MQLKQVNRYHKLVCLINIKKRISLFFSSESNIIRSDDTYAKDRIWSIRLKLNGINSAVIIAYVLEKERLEKFLLIWLFFFC